MTQKSIKDSQIKAFIREALPGTLSIGDPPGLNLTLSKSGTAAWILRYRTAGKQKELTLGRYPDISLSDVRERARDKRGEVQVGVDIALLKQRTIAEAKSAMTFGELVDDYLDKAVLSKKTIADRQEFLRNLIRPAVGAIPAKEVTGGDIVRILETTGRKRSAKVAEKVLHFLRSVVKHGFARHILENDPVGKASVAAICGQKDPVRARLNLTDAEIMKLMVALDATDVRAAAVFRILLAAGFRIGETFQLHWEYFDGDLLTIPGDITKKRTAVTDKPDFRVPISPYLQRQFDTLRNLAGASEWVLPALGKGRKSSHGFADPQAFNNRLRLTCANLGIREITPHDLRSSFRSRITDEAHGADVVTAERALNHQLSGLLQVYDKSDYFDQRRRVMESWHAYLEKLDTMQVTV